jgi:hypothetical protein
VSILQDKIAKYIEYLGVSIAKLAGSKTIYKYPFSPMGLVTLKKHLADFGAGGATWGSCRVRRPSKTAGSHHQLAFQRLIRVISCREEEARLELREKRGESLPKSIA